MLQNVRLLKWALYHQIHVSWNLLYGFPGETDEDYRRQLDVVRLIPHLQPPQRHSRIWLERFAPYFTDRETYPLRAACPDPSYRHAYPEALGLDYDKIAYFYEHEMGDTVAAEVHRETGEAVRVWKERWDSDHPATLSYRRTLGGILIDDNRSPQGGLTYTFDGPLALLYESCGDTMRTVPQIAERLAASGVPIKDEDVRANLEEFCRRGLILEEEGRFLSLALPANRNW